jgi:uncharacterized membrane protein YoaK (UPF0700 family)
VGAVAIVSFVAGSCGGTAYGRGHARPLRAARDVLLVETVLLALVAAIANVIPADVFAWRLVFLGLAAFGMALQQTATRLLHPTQSVSTTYMSGTIERIGSGLVEAVAARSWGGLTLNGAVWLAFALAAFGAGSAAGSLVTVVPCALAAAAAVSLRRA